MYFALHATLMIQTGYLFASFRSFVGEYIRCLACMEQGAWCLLSSRVAAGFV